MASAVTRQVVVHFKGQDLEILDLRRDAETRASYQRRAAELELFGAARTKPTSALRHRPASPQAVSYRVKDDRVVQIRFHVSHALFSALSRHRATTNEGWSDYFAGLVHRTSLDTRFVSHTPVTLWLPHDVAGNVDIDQLTDYAVRTFRQNKDTAS